MACQSLFPSLPPEIRQLIYSHTVVTTNSATNLDLPLGIKTFASSHATTSIAPVHHGLGDLLHLRKCNVLEGHEYHDYLLQKATKLRIAVHFRGDLQTFVQEHWDQKMVLHLKKLQRNHPWLRWITDIEIKILWGPKAWTGSPTRNRMGSIVARMVDVFARMVDGKSHFALERKVQLDLYLPPYLKASFFREAESLSNAQVHWIEAKAAACEQSHKMALVSRQETTGSRLLTANIGGLPSHLRALPAKSDPRLLVMQSGKLEWGRHFLEFHDH